MTGLALLLIAGLFLGNMVTLVDQTMTGSIQVSTNFGINQFETLSGMENALQTADALAQHYHAQRIYSMFDPQHESSLIYLSQFTKTPVALFDRSNCVMLPNSSVGPVIYLTIAGNPLLDQLLATYANRTLLTTVTRLGYPQLPFQIYLVTPKPAPEVVRGTYTSGLQAIDTTMRLFHAANYTYLSSWPSGQALVSRWLLNDTHTPAPDVEYFYRFIYQTLGEGTECHFNRTWAGDQVLAIHQELLSYAIPSQITLQISVNESGPQLFHFGSLTLRTDNRVDTPLRQLVTDDQGNSQTFMVRSV
jgi:hypothetical protein